VIAKAYVVADVSSGQILASEKADERYYTTLLLHDDRQGAPIALMDGSLVGSLRTPAATALIARASARSDARTALVVGSGVQGQTALPFLVEAMPQLQRLIVHGHHGDGVPGGDVGDVIAGAGELGQDDIAGHHDVFRG